jgi:hypothetical protein
MIFCLSCNPQQKNFLWLPKGLFLFPKKQEIYYKPSLKNLPTLALFSGGMKFATKISPLYFILGLLRTKQNHKKMFFWLSELVLYADFSLFLLKS